MDARAGHAVNVPVAAQADAPAASTPLPRGVEWSRQATTILTIVVALAAGLALVPPFAAQVFFHNATAAANNAYLDDAEANILRAISWTPQDAYLHQFLGEIYFRKALFRPQQRKAYLEEALVAFQRSARMNPYEAETFALIGWTHLYGANPAAAETAFIKAKELDPNSLYVRYSLGTAYLWQKKLSQARAELEFARRYLPGAPEVVIALREIDRLEGARQP